MCGIAAIFAYSSDAPGVDRGELIAIRDQMIARGPDGAGDWFSPDGRVGLGHRRLSIIDLSDNGRQPMHSADGRYIIIFNGEIYNYEALRTRLQGRGRVFRSDSDTEVLLHLYAEQGSKMVDGLRGMYAFAIWDNRERTLFLARDPFGIKPLYYVDDGRTIRVASQVKALLQSKHIDTAPEPAGHVGFFLWGSIPDPFTLYRGIKALPAGHHMLIESASAARSPSSAVSTSFCSIPRILRETENSEPLPSHLSPLTSILADSIQHHLVSDVPVGIFLSAGIDSTTIASYVSARHSDVRTVTLGFTEFKGRAEDEVPLAEKMARSCGANHQTIWVTRSDFEQHTRRLLDAMDQPSIDGVNTYFVSMAARQAGLKVALSGLGGDELFGGYPSFREIPPAVHALEPFQAVPAFGRAFRVVSAGVLRRYTSPKYAGLFEYGPTFGGAYLLRRGLFMPWELPTVLNPDLVREGWQRLNTIAALNATAALDSTASSDTSPLTPHSSPRCRIAALELCWYMRHQLLRDSDWAGMAHSLEIRVPLVDLALFRRLAPALASRRPPGKLDLGSSAPRPLLAEITQRTKTGFTVPVRDWLLESAVSSQLLSHNSAASARGLRGWAQLAYSQLARN